MASQLPSKPRLSDEGIVASTLTSREIEAAARVHLYSVVLDLRRPGCSEDDEWAALFALVQRPVLTVLRHVYGIVSIEDQDDLFQEVMLRFYRGRRRFDLKRPLLPWLYTIARNVKLDWQKESRLRAQSPLIEQSSSDNTEPKFIAKDVLAKLDEADRNILWLSYNEGLTDKELAKDLGVALSTAKFYLRRAKKKARDILTADSRLGGKNEK